ncbi:hypothetical protein KC19_12G059100 [Ceratodon purpureus]|uniref:Uncharacterized protein n=1 Tax=Ceratodon purpureus TaxID=3225 RepID=A0A8T0G843_CERPU|nr:hypothetical protein KC19_12G059100 [Ceratodon purpureus]
MRDDSASGLGIWGSFRQCASPAVRSDLQSDYKLPGASKWRRLCQQPKYVSCVALALGLILILSTVLVNEQMHMSSFLDRVAASFKTEGLSVNGTDGCDSSSNLSSNSSSDLPSKPCRQAAEDIPRGMVVATTDLEMRSLYEEDEKKLQKAKKKNLLAMAVGIKQKQVVDDIVQKFPLNSFTIMLFHYDGIVDQWQDLAWSNQSLHIVALHQTKWWYAKRFMHPDIVDQYNYIFLWDEDLGVEHFHADRYLKIMEAEGLEISQPALDPASVDIHHRITRRHPRLIAHKAIYTKTCTPKNKAVPCTGYVEVMAPVFSKAAWKCVWHMIQNDLIHGWGMDFKIGYCAQGLRSEKVGVIDAEYILHKGIPSLGGPHVNKTILTQEDSNSVNHKIGSLHDPRQEVRKKSSQEMLAFQNRWEQAVRDDPTWMDPYAKYAKDEMDHINNRAVGAMH